MLSFSLLDRLGETESIITPFFYVLFYLQTTGKTLALITLITLVLEQIVVSREEVKGRGGGLNLAISEKASKSRYITNTFQKDIWHGMARQGM